ncbi:molybdenum cofactor biosynthesis protein MoaE [Agaricicola taiwanensis]|uniref:Molybdopterin synthase catalytic subunit n=1 Tax=Agaricicola taiwanensis TaxID=591372 RepID=A0A8J2YF43_9RHOB|nr:molybdenum cofactor biosynthesis protein MoaE [Agaricicola taiwanensis]GGE40293.1 molybdenum cofactor biosynthesis protein MoaE [Agaricicola taiwanensis]
MDVRVQSDPIDVGAETARFSAGRTDVGAVVTFTGLCRDEGGRLTALHIEHYPGMAEDEITRVADEARERFSVVDVTVVHRFGRIRPGETIVFVATASAHRGDAFAAAGFMMDYLKTRAPFWKKEEGADGAWVAASDRDEGAAARWSEEL